MVYDLLDTAKYTDFWSVKKSNFAVINTLDNKINQDFKSIIPCLMILHTDNHKFQHEQVKYNLLNNYVEPWVILPQNTRIVCYTHRSYLKIK